ncbi:MAG: hypothetical protein RLZZ179_391 [Verrucomicrobiota bacterium]|jgi:hypothetical protein
MRLRVICVLLLLLSGLGVADEGVAGNDAAAEAVVEGLLYFASDDAGSPLPEKAVEIDAGLQQALSVRLAKVFGFRHYHLMGRHTQKVFKEYESWVVPSKDLCLRIDSRGPAEGGGVSVHLQLWQDKKVLVKSDAVIRPGRPVFLGGPKWRGGRLVFVVMQRAGGKEE